jgi:O-antigen biosynthesis protein
VTGTAQVSLLIPAYNARFFEPCLASAIGQTHAGIEIIVADDSPGTAIADATARLGAGRVRYLRNPVRRGFHGNFAQLFALAGGRYVKFLNDDDVLHPDCVARMVAVFESLGSRIALAACRRRLIDEAGAPLPDTAATTPLAERDCVINGRGLGNLLLATSVNRVGEPSAAMFRKGDVALKGDTLFRIADQEFTCLADLALWLRLLAGGSLAYLAAPLCSIRTHPGRLQETDEVAARCVAERYYLPRDARGIGYLDDDADFRAATRIGIDLVTTVLGQPGLGAAAHAILETAQRQIAADARRSA